MFLPIGTSMRISALILLPVFLVSCNALDAGAQNETTDSQSQVISRANETSSTGNDNGSTPILFEATSESDRSDQQAASQRYTFPEPGFYTLRIDNIGNTTASIDLPMQVIPEFSGAASATALTAGLLATILFIVRFKIGRAGFFRAGDLRRKLPSH